MCFAHLGKQAVKCGADMIKASAGGLPPAFELPQRGIESRFACTIAGQCIFGFRQHACELLGVHHDLLVSASAVSSPACGSSGLAKSSAACSRKLRSLSARAISDRCASSSPSCFAETGPGIGDEARFGFKTAERVDQPAVIADIDKRAVGMLTADLAEAPRLGATGSRSRVDR